MMDNFACRCQTAPALSSDRPQAIRLYLSDLRTKVMYEYEIPLVKALILVSERIPLWKSLAYFRLARNSSLFALDFRHEIYVQIFKTNIY